MRLNHTGTVLDKQRDSVKADNVLQLLKNSSPAQIETWVDNNINTLTDAKLLFKRILKLLSYLSKEV